MDKDRIKGVAKEVSGSIKETVGKVTGDHKLEAKGAIEHAEGKIQNTVGVAKDEVRAALKPKS